MHRGQTCVLKIVVSLRFFVLGYTIIPNEITYDDIREVYTYI